MSSRTLVRVGVIACALLICGLSSGIAWAQTSSGSIAGTVRDASGAVLPGVTVEVTSPALIEKVRVSQSDGAGLYKITELPPGVYEVTFALGGFNTVKQTGIELTTGFTASVNAELRVGSLNETITVSGQSPVVDVQNSHQQVVMTRDVIDAVPTGKNFQNLAVLIPGMSVGPAAAVQQDVGGGAGQALQVMFIHGGRDSDMQTQVNGMSVQTMTSFARSAQPLNDSTYQEVAFDVSANSAEIESGGVRVNLVPRDGANVFQGAFFGSGAINSLQPSNLTDRLRGLGVTDINRTKRLWEVTPSLGGPIARDRVWFFGSFKESRADTYIANSYEAVDPGAWVYTADRSKQARRDVSTREGSVRLAWQATNKHKLGLLVSRSNICQCQHFYFVQNARIEATTRIDSRNWLTQGTWTAPMTNRFLIDVGISAAPAYLIYGPQPEAVAPRIFDAGFGFAYRGPSNLMDADTTNWSQRGTISYVTGSHAFKVGYTYLAGTAAFFQKTLGNQSFTALNGVPLQVTYVGHPFLATNQINGNLGIFAQDQWTLGRLTLGLGVRYDHFRSGYPAESVGPTQYVLNSREFPALEAVNWKDISPRLGLAYDVFGNGKTAFKASVNRYVLQQGTNMAVSINPIASNNTNPRAWTDANGDRVVQGDPFNNAANGELGPSLNLNFGRPIITYSYDPAFARGFGVRPANWEFAAGVQHELMPRVSANVQFVRRVYVNFMANDNTAVGADDYDSFCVAVPQDQRLGNSGSQLCGVMSLKPASLPLAAAGKIVGMPAEAFGSQTEHWNGADFTIQARMPKVLLQGGLSTGRTSLNVCDIMRAAPENYFAVPALPAPVPASPALPLGNIPLDYCDVDTGFLTQLKLIGSYTLPFDISVAATLQNLPGPQLIANGTYTNAQVTPILGRALSEGASVPVNLIRPGSMFGDRLTQLDLRFSKTFRIRTVSLQGLFDLYNLANASPVTQQSTTYGATTGAAQGSAFLPTQVLSPRTVRAGVQMRF